MSNKIFYRPADMIGLVMNFDTIAPHSLWHFLTRLGEVQILIPAALLVLMVMLRQRHSRAAGVEWLVGLSAASFLTALSKVAFIGWGLGYAPLDFTGVSGHSMFAAAVFPILLGAMVPATPLRGRHAALAAGFALAMVVGASRLAVGAHSLPEVIAGLVLGGTVSWHCARRHLHTLEQPNPAILLLIAVWLAVSPWQSPQIQTHSAVTQLALALSGHSSPFTRSEMLRDYDKARRDLHRDGLHNPK